MGKRSTLIIIALAVILAAALVANSLIFRSENTISEPSNKNAVLPPEKSTTEENLILPDLQTSAPKELFITGQGNSRKIRFSTQTLNNGLGELRILGESDPVRKITKATQIIKQKDGQEFRKEIGEFIFHPGHGHWHVEKFTQFQLWSLKEDSQPDKVITTTDKMSFCLWDQEKLDSRQGSPAVGIFGRDCKNETQGMSPGWSDTYPAELVGQELDISSVKDGSYAIVSIVNPDKKILESDYGNNSVTAYVELKNNSIRLTVSRDN